MIMPPAKLVALVKAQPATNVELMPGFDDIWTTDSLVDEHIDHSCVPGFYSYLWIIQNDQGCLLRTVDGQTRLPVGATLRLNSLSPHATVMPRNKPFAGGRLAFLAWDMPPDYTLREFRAALVHRLVEYDS